MRLQNTVTLIVIAVLFYSCSGKVQQSNERHTTIRKSKAFTKPGSTYQDTLVVAGPAAVFYAPDSLQLNKIREVTEHWVFEGSMHEYDSQIKNSHRYLKSDWPQIKIMEAKNVRYLRFIKANKSSYLVDLDKRGDVYGLFVFNEKKDALQVDMMNVETQVSDYFNRN